MRNIVKDTIEKLHVLCLTSKLRPKPIMEHSHSAKNSQLVWGQFACSPSNYRSEAFNFLGLLWAGEDGVSDTLPGP